MEIRNKQLNAVYNGIETIINEGFTMQSNYILPLLARMKDEKIINDSACVVIQTILTFKHTEANPFPSNEKIAQLLGRTIFYVQKAMKSIRKAGVLGIIKMVDKVTGKDKKNNQYDFKPFFAILEKFIVEYKNENYDVSISELMNVKIVNTKSEKPFPAIKPAKKEVVAVTPVAPVTLQDAPQTIVSIPQTTLPEDISNVVQAYSVDAEGIKAVESAYTAFSSKVSNGLFIEKIISAIGKHNFTSYFTTSIVNASNNNEQLAPARKSGQGSYTGKATREDVVPGWYDKTQEEKRAGIKPQTTEGKYAEMTYEELLEAETNNKELIADFPENISLYDVEKLIKDCMKKFEEEGVL